MLLLPTLRIPLGLIAPSTGLKLSDIIPIGMITVAAILAKSSPAHRKADRVFANALANTHYPTKLSAENLSADVWKDRD